MKKKNFFRSNLLTVIKMMIPAIIIWFSTSTCKLMSKRQDITHVDSGKAWISWNVYFQPGTDQNTRQNILSGYCTYLSNYLAQKDPTATIHCTIVTCPCDSSLANIDARIVGGTGQTVPTPPTNPPPGPTGDYTLSNNIQFDMPETKDSIYYDTTAKFNLVGPNQTNDSVIAVIDTGLDTARFSTSIGNLVWTAPPSSTVGTIVSVIPGESYYTLKDDNHVKHGTAVSGIILNQNPERKPKIMVIRAFDALANGSIYTVSCALSYAIQNHVSLVNASWGYYGDEDSILKRYIDLAHQNAIPVIAAAGNTPGSHNRNLLCNATINPGNLLTTDPKRLFFPACFSTSYDNVVTVTTLNKNDVSGLIPCYYQNYSSQFVTVGVETGGNACCIFEHPAGGFIEGSSFATPVITGRILKLLRPLVTAKTIIETNSQKSPPPLYTLNGNYIGY